jgi:hypothetical protein
MIDRSIKSVSESSDNRNQMFPRLKIFARSVIPDKIVEHRLATVPVVKGTVVFLGISSISYYIFRTQIKREGMDVVSDIVKSRNVIQSVEEIINDDHVKGQLELLFVDLFKRQEIIDKLADLTKNIIQRPDVEDQFKSLIHRTFNDPATIALLRQRITSLCEDEENRRDVSNLLKDAVSRREFEDQLTDTIKSSVSGIFFKKATKN